MKIRHHPHLMVLLILAATACLAQQAPDEKLTCPATEVLEAGKCVFKSTDTAVQPSDGNANSAGLGEVSGESAARKSHDTKSQSTDEPKPVSKERPRPPQIKECPAQQMLQDGKCVPIPQ